LVYIVITKNEIEKRLRKFMFDFLIKSLNQQNVEKNAGEEIEEVWIVWGRNQRWPILHDSSV